MSTDRGMDKKDVIHTYNRILLSHKKNEIMPFAATWMLGIIILSQTKKHKYLLHAESKRTMQMKLFAKQKLREQNCGYQGEGCMGRDS